MTTPIHPLDTPDCISPAWVQEVMSVLITGDAAFAEAFVLAHQDSWPSLSQWAASSFGPTDEAGARFLLEIHGADNHLFWQLWSLPLHESELKEWLSTPLPMHVPVPSAHEPERSVPHVPDVTVSKTGVLRDVYDAANLSSPQTNTRRPPIPQGSVVSRESALALRPRFKDLILPPRVTGGTGPGRLGATGICVLGPGLAVEPNSISNPHSTLAEQLNADPVLHTYGWMAGHIINSEWSTGDVCTVLTTHANTKHKNEFERVVRTALHHLRNCYTALHECGVDTSRLEFGILVEIRVSKTSWADAYPDFGCDASTHELCRSIPSRITCRADLVEVPHPDQVVRLAAPNVTGPQRYQNMLGTLMTEMERVAEVEVQNRRAKDGPSEKAAGEQRTKRRAEAAARMRHKRARGKERKREVAEKFIRLTEARLPYRRGTKWTRAELYASYKAFPREELAQLLTEEELETLERFLEL
ncbi:hypothetical protein [Streptomyces sp. NPDC057910]|uniref:hypothetical protein n=1 Tax=Streptomyces sp. NPDC057910 TaxID=3346278 RepID=UPI0036E91F7E